MVRFQSFSEQAFLLRESCSEEAFLFGQSYSEQAFLAGGPLPILTPPNGLGLDTCYDVR